MKLTKISSLFFFLLILAGLVTAFPALAQYENDPEANAVKEITPNPDQSFGDDKSLVVEHERSSRYRDSTHVRSTSPLKAKSSDQLKPSAAKEEDALSFNFLYYIIEKFKISDLVDD